MTHEQHTRAEIEKEKGKLFNCSTIIVIVF